MPGFRSIATFLGVFGAGAVVAGFFLSGPVERPPDVQPQVHPQAQIQAPPTAQAGSSTTPAAAPSAPSATDPANMLSPRPVRTIPVLKPAGSNPETTGGSPGEPASQTAPAPAQDQAAPAAPQAQPAPAAADAFACDYQACRRKYRSFDSRTCTYQPHRRGPRELCDR